MLAARSLVATGLILGALALPAQGQVRAMAKRIVGGGGGNQPAAGMVNLPYSFNDNTGNQWFFYQYGQFQQQGNMPVYSQGAMLQVNNQYPQARNNQAKVDEKSGELVFENMAVGGVSLTRRIQINKEEGWVRYIDIVKNTGGAEAAVNLNFSSNLNYGVQNAVMVPDPKKKDNNLAWVALTHGQGKTVVEMYGGKGAKVIPTIQYNQGNSQMNALLNPSIPAGKEIAIMHFHAITSSQEAGTKYVMNMKESRIMASIPTAIRKLIINFRGGENFVGDYEILRGDILDVVELRSGDQLKGTLKEKSFKLDTFYGPVELPVDKVIGLINAGQFRPRQLLVTKDGEIFGGKLDREKLVLELSSGQVTDIPISAISRMGYRKRSGEPEEWTFEKPVVLMRTGDRIGVQMPTRDIEAATRYGPLKLKPDSVASIDFQSEENSVHQISLRDGSKFAGLVNGDVFEMRLGSEGPEQVVKFPASSIRRLQLTNKTDDADDDQSTLNLANEDLLVGSLTGTLKLDTAFSTLSLNAGEIKKLIHTAGAPSDVQVVLWDETTVSGQLQEQELAVLLKSGVAMKVPVALVEEYNQPRPTASGAVVESIKRLVGELNSEDWKQRDAAQEKLIAMGPVVISTIRQIRAGQPPEAQQRIDLVLKQLEKDSKNAKPGAAGGAGGAAAPPVIIDQFAPQFEDILK